jgi:myosin heavy subunit
MLFAAQFVVNELLRRKNLEFSDNVSVEILTSINCKSASDIPRLFQDFQEQLKTLQNQKQEIETKYSKLEKVLIERNRRTSEQISSIQRLRLQNRDLQSQVAVLELSIQTNEVVTASMRLEGPTEGNETIAELEEQNKNLLTELEQTHTVAEKALKKLEKAKEILAEKNHIFATETESWKQRLKDQKKKEKHKLQALTSQFQHELQASTAQLEESKQSFEANFERLKTRMEESRGISNDRIHALEESEQKCQKLAAENARLQLLERTCNLKVASLEEQLSKERRFAQTQISAQRLAFESQLHEIASRVQKRHGEEGQDENLPNNYHGDSHLSCDRPWPLVKAVE